MKQFLGTVIFLWIGMNALCGQTTPLESLTINDGLSQGMINSALQDREGFLWIATKDGLNRYDGYDFTLFSHSSDQPYSISGHIVSALLEDSRGWLWVGTENNGLNLFDKTTEKFYRLQAGGNETAGLRSAKVMTLAEDPYGDIWVGSDVGLDRIVIPREFSLSQLRSNDLNAIFRVITETQDVAQVSSICFEDGQVRVGDRQGLFSRPIKGGRWQEIKLGGPFLVAAATEIGRDRYGALWVARLHGLTRLGPDGQQKHYPLSIAERMPKLQAMLEADGRHLLMGYTRLERLVLDDAGVAKQSVISHFDRFACSSMAIDRSGIVWVGSNGFGLYKYNPRKADFNHYMPGKSLQQIYEDRQERLWVWAGHQLSWLDAATGALRLPEGFPTDLTRARQLVQDPQGRYWFHLPFEEAGFKVSCYDPRTRERRDFPYTCEADPLTPMFISREGKLWVGCLAGMLIELDIHSGKMVYHQIDDYFVRNRSGIKASVFYEDSQGSLWIGATHGLLRMSRLKDGRVGFKAYQTQPGGLSENYILSILEDPQMPEILWLGTKGGGLNRFDTRAETFSVFGIKEGLPNHVIYGILPDLSAPGNPALWLSTNRGLCRFQLGNYSCRNYLAADGLQDNEFNTGAYCKTRAGALVFGGINGLNAFFPERLSQNNHQPPVLITGLRVNNQPIAPDTSGQGILAQVVNFTKAIRLRHHENMVSLRFSVLDYAAPEKNTYRYQLEGVDEDWVEAGYRREVTYTNLPPGKYTFKVQGASGRSQWSPEAMATMDITVLPPWWKTIWAWALWLTLAGLLAYSIQRVQINRVRLENQLQYEHRESERLAALGRMKTNFFSNITHEFRTPLTLILEPLRQVKNQLSDAESVAKLEMAERNGRQLLGLVNQLLDLSKLESGAMTLDTRPGDLEASVRHTTDTFRPLTQKRGIDLQYEPPATPLPIFAFDPQKVELIINNLLSNAIKFTPSGGRITLSLSRAERQAKLMVADTGSGISAESLPRIFDRFYQAPGESADLAQTGGGAGIGLALTKELVELMGGLIYVESSPGQGATFTVQFPIVSPQPEAVNSEPVNTLPVATDLPFVSPDDEPADSDMPLALIIEDNDDLRTFIQLTLQPHYKVITAIHGEEGIKKALEAVPDLVITDLMMPLANGYQVCETLKDHELTSHIPIIMLTAKSAMEKRLQGLRSGADDYLTKPFHTEELLVRAENLIATRRRIREKFGQNLLPQAICAQVEEEAFSKADQDFLNRITQLLEERLEDESLSVEDVARMLYLSRTQLHRKLKALTDQPANEFIRNYRLDRAMEMLRRREGNVTEIAVRTGFNSQKYFSVRFKERFGMSPSEV